MEQCAAGDSGADGGAPPADTDTLLDSRDSRFSVPVRVCACCNLLCSRAWCSCGQRGGGGIGRRAGWGWAGAVGEA